MELNIVNCVRLPEAIWDGILSRYPNIRVWNPNGEEDYTPYLDQANVIFGNCPQKLLAGLTRLKWIQIVSSGIDEYTGLKERKVLVTTAKGVHWEPIAEYTVFSMLYLVRKHWEFHYRKELKEWYRKPDEIAMLKGQWIGLIGYGGIAKTLVRYLGVFGVSIVCVTSNPPDTQPAGIAVWGMERLPELLGTSDHIVLSLPLTAESKWLIDGDMLGRFKRGSFLYNMSRGALIHEPSLISYLESGWLSGAALDVFEEEPLPLESPLWGMPNVLLTPHIAGHYHGLRKDIFRLFEHNLENYLNGRELTNIADFNKGY